jgi:hypothetical protein
LINVLFARVLGMLPSPEIIRTVINKIIKAFEDTQTELIRVRWEEIERLQPQILPVIEQSK